MNKNLLLAGFAMLLGIAAASAAELTSLHEVVGTDATWTCMPSTHTEFRWGWCGNGREHIDRWQTR